MEERQVHILLILGLNLGFSFGFAAEKQLLFQFTLLCSEMMSGKVGFHIS